MKSAWPCIYQCISFWWYRLQLYAVSVSCFLIFVTILPLISSLRFVRNSSEKITDGNLKHRYIFHTFRWDQWSRSLLTFEFHSIFHNTSQFVCVCKLFPAFKSPPEVVHNLIVTTEYSYFERSGAVRKYSLRQQRAFLWR